jgi:single-strand DNA-binding protein
MEARKMSYVNKVILIGRLGADPDMRYTADGTPVATFRIATTESYKNKDGTKVDQTEWHHIVAWRKLGEISGQYLKKGKLVYIEGKIQSREYEGRDGVKRKTFEIVASNMKMLGGGGPDEKRSYGGGGGGEHVEEDFVHEPADDDDIPL